ncbi:MULTISPECIES: HAD family hydrolase [Prauserella salsuginis group]|uniref:HAD superfamily hydrolase (TIGR01509 family) n=2 Tax=Prauserella salsuginis group TaxID=2893672 RepID=A0A839XSF3_9PSEU|nr:MULTISPECIES: HAD family phosphatase [Prauserella salsuginis group]MBB3662795.1 HAD superfamily hydrolase (TIGR01509 family) [Prauserella sediminis]MCR3720491.1 haloacid dehalogenase superfamily, subfamily IA, variant 3 with third motif having DD or ED [Prauserella flava]MCR3733799.1 haloacid dehalogenase superfamily, subfamily IA, variant 3 with third motif having DD or ED [Prauserella salsuginis]
MQAIVFDMDGVLVDSEQLWDEVRRSVAASHGGTWNGEATRAMQGMSTPEWAEYLVTEVGVQLTPDEVARTVIDEMRNRYAGAPPVLPGAAETLSRIAAQYPAAIASSSPPVLIESFLSATGLTSQVPVAVSSEQVAKGKPAPDVYLEAASQLGIAPRECAAVEDSTSGLQAALAAEMTVFAVPNPHYPPDETVVARTHRVLGGITELPAALDL